MSSWPDNRDKFGVNPGAAIGPHSSDEEATVNPTESGLVLQDLLALAKQAAAPQLTRVALDQRFGPRSTWTPAVGQLWRAVGEDVTALVLLLAVEAESVTIVPATVESSSDTSGENDAVILDDTVLRVPVTVLAGLRRTLPMSVLDRPVDDLAADILPRIAERAAAATAGVDIAPDDIRAELADDLDLLAEAAAGTAPDQPSVAVQDPIGIDLNALDPEALDQAAARLKVPLPVVLDLIDGKRPPTPVEADVLREVLGAAPQPTPPPPALVVELSHPRWRSLIRLQARRSSLTEADARSALAYDVNAMAARQTGDAEPSWPDRIRRWTQAHQLDPDADI